MPEPQAISAEQMKLVLDVSRLLTVTADLDALLKSIAEAATSLLAAERASIFLHDQASDELWSKVALGAGEIRVPASAGIVGHVFRSNELLDVPDPYEDARFNREIDRRDGFVTRNLLTAPMRNIDGHPLGVLQVVNRLDGPFTASDRTMIQLLADHAGVAIQRFRLQQEVARAAGLRHEMDLAQRVQAAMIPEHPPQLPQLQAVGWMRPASITGGDCYDLWKMPDGRLGLFLGDASGHGIAPAIVVSQARTLVRALAGINCDPAWLLSSVNARLTEDLELGRFVTAFLGCLASDGSLSWCSAGQGPILLKRSATAEFELLEPLGPPIGVVPELRFDSAPPIRLEDGGTLVVISDGIFESRNGSSEMLDLERVIALLSSCEDAPPAVMLSVLRQAVRQWQGREEPLDDQTAVIVQRTDHRK